MSNLGPDDLNSPRTTVNPAGSQPRMLEAAPNRTGYWIAGAVAVVAIVAVVFLVVSHNNSNQATDPNATQAAVNNAYQQGQTQAQIDASNQVAAANQAAANQAAIAQTAQSQAAATQAALAQSTDAANRAAARAERAAERNGDQSKTAQVTQSPSDDSSPH